MEILQKVSSDIRREHSVTLLGSGKGKVSSGSDVATDMVGQELNLLASSSS